MSADAGEQIVGCYLQKIELCDFVSYNIRPPGGGRGSLSELDVIGMRLRDKRVFLCEVAIHLNGFNYGKGSQQDIQRVINKYDVQRDYAANHLKDFTPEFMLWSPFFPSSGKVYDAVNSLNGLQLVANDDFKECLNKLRSLAASETHDSGNDFFRLLQITERI